MRLLTAFAVTALAGRNRRSSGHQECIGYCDDDNNDQLFDSEEEYNLCKSDCNDEYGVGSVVSSSGDEFLQCEVYEIDPFNFCCPAGLDVNKYWPIDKPEQRGHRPLAPDQECATGCKIAREVDQFVCAFYQRVHELEIILIDLANAMKNDIDGIMELRQKFVRRYREISTKNARSIEKIEEIGETFINLIKLGIDNEDLIEEATRELGIAETNAQVTKAAMAKLKSFCEIGKQCVKQSYFEPHLFGGIKKDCADYFHQNYWTSRDANPLWNSLPQSGVYQIQPNAALDPFFVYCDQKTDGGGWTLIQHNGISRKELWDTYNDNMEQLKTNWDRNWNNYKAGFGHISSNGEADFWLGLERMYYLTHPTFNNKKQSTLRIDLVDWEGEEYFGYYHNARIDSERRNYRLVAKEFAGVGSYSIGDAFAGMAFDGDSDQIAATRQNYQSFSTHDNDNDKLCKWSRNNMKTVFGQSVPNFNDDDMAARCGEVVDMFYNADWEGKLKKWGSCAQQDGAGFWYNRCSAGNLNGKVYGEHGTGFYELNTITLEDSGIEMMQKNHDDGLIWGTLHRGRDYSFMMAEMRVRPTDFVGYSATLGLETLRNGRAMDQNKSN